MWQLEEILQDYILCHSLAIWGKKWVPLGFVSLLSCVNIRCVLNVSSSQLECRKLNPHCNTVGNGALGEVFRTPGFCPSEWMELLQKSLIEAVSLCPFWLLTWAQERPSPDTTSRHLGLRFPSSNPWEMSFLCRLLNFKHLSWHQMDEHNISWGCFAKTLYGGGMHIGIWWIFKKIHSWNKTNKGAPKHTQFKDT